MAQQPTADSGLKEKEFKEGDDQDQCPICLAQFNRRETVCVLPCQHSYHHTCVERWIRERSPTCPVCRQNVGLERALASAAQLLSTHLEEMRRWVTEVSPVLNSPMADLASLEDTPQLDLLALRRVFSFISSQANAS